MLDLDAIEAVVAGVATLLPWDERNEGPGEPWHVAHDGEYVLFVGYDLAAELARGDAEFIAEASRSVPALIAEVRRLRDESEKLRASAHVGDAFIGAFGGGD